MFYFALRIVLGGILLLATRGSSDELYDNVEAADTADCLKKARVLVVYVSLTIRALSQESFEHRLVCDQDISRNFYRAKENPPNLIDEERTI